MPIKLSLLNLCWNMRLDATIKLFATCMHASEAILPAGQPTGRTTDFRFHLSWFSFPPKSIFHLFAMYVSSRMPNILTVCADVGSLELLILQIVVIIISQFLLNFFHAFCVTAWLLSVIWSILFATRWCHWNFRFKMGDILHTVKGDHGGYKVVMNTVTMYIIHMYLN